MNPLGGTEILVSSKGLGAKKLVLKESEGNAYWTVLKNFPIENLAKHVANAITDGTVTKVAVFGETFGSKVQDLHYGFTNGNLGFSVFDIFVEVTGAEGTEGFWVNPELVAEYTETVGIPTVPRLYEGPFSIEKVTELASGKEQVSGRELHIREGVVVRPVQREKGYSEGSKKIAKYVSDAYLTRKGGTEFN